MNDWLDDILDGEPTGITDTQWLIIESNIHRTALPPHYVDDVMQRLNDLTELEAEEIIKQINENKCSWCDCNIEKFRDTNSRTEYLISGLCQDCQDATFKEAN